LPEEAIPTEIEENGGHLNTRPDFELTNNQAVEVGRKVMKGSFNRTSTFSKNRS